MDDDSIDMFGEVHGKDYDSIGIFGDVHGKDYSGNLRQDVEIPVKTVLSAAPGSGMKLGWVQGVIRWDAKTGSKKRKTMLYQSGNVHLHDHVMYTAVGSMAKVVEF